MVRKDLREGGELRVCSVELGLVGEADGSAAVSMGDTRVVASLVGPTQPRYGRHELYNQASIEIEINLPNKSVVDGADVNQQKRKYEKFLKEGISGCVDLSKYPRMLILFSVLIINNDGALMSVALNACVLALLDAGVPMHYAPSAVTISAFSQNSETKKYLLLDPTQEEEKDSLANSTIVLRPPGVVGVNSAEACVICSESTGIVSIDTFKNVMTLAAEASLSIHETMKKFMEAKHMGSSL